MKQPGFGRFTRWDALFACPLALAWSLSAAAGLSSCKSRDSVGANPMAAGSSSAGTAPLDPELAKRVLAKVGERTITLADFAQALERMDRFERLRYQTKERRLLLLNEMIDTELLAREAERLGLDKEPATQAAMHQALREEGLRELRRGQPALSDLPSAEVQAYFSAHPEEFSDPERRRVSVIAVRSAEQGRKLANQLQGASGRSWGEAVYKYSTLAGRSMSASNNASATRPPLELAGDLGFVSAPGQERGDNPEVPAEVRALAFSLSAPEAVAPEAVKSGALYYVVRLVAVNPPRSRSLSEADTMIRARILADRLHNAERELEAKLRHDKPVVINEALLSQVRASGTKE